MKVALIQQFAEADKNKNILNVKELPKHISFVKPNDLLAPEDLIKFQPYINNCNSFHFFVHQYPKSLHYSSIIKSFKLAKYINQLNPDYIHFDDVSVRFASLIFFLNKKRKIIINVHDPVQHSG